MSDRMSDPGVAPAPAPSPSPAPRVHEPAVARVHLVASMAYLLVGVAGLAVRGVSLPALLDAVPPVAMGAFVILIVGTSRLLLSGMADRPVAAPRLRWVPLILIMAGSGAFALDADLQPPLLAVAGGAWGAGVFLHVGIVAATVRRPRRRPLDRDRRPDPGRPRREGLVGVLHVGSLVYAVAAAAAVPLGYAGVVAAPVAVHLLLAGFVTLTIAGVACHAYPRFTGVPFPRAALAAMTVPLVVGPGLVAVGLAGAPRILAVGGVLEAVGLVTLAAGLLSMTARSDRSDRPRPGLAGVGAAAVFLLAGAAMGGWFAVDPASRVLAPVHGLTNLLGFVGLIVIGFVVELYAPALRTDPGLFALQARVTVGLAAGGVVVADAGALAGAPLVVTAGLALFAAAVGLHLAGAAAAYLRTVRPIPLGEVSG